MNDEIFQESPMRKAAWLTDAQKHFPIGARVRVVKSDIPEYVGAFGVVVGHDVGTDGDWPLISVQFDAPITYAQGRRQDIAAGDGFYGDGDSDDEIVLVDGGL